MASEDLLGFLVAVDSELTSHAGPDETLALHLLGRSALIIGYGVELTTKDVDVVARDSCRLLDIAVELFGKSTAGVRSPPFYLETVSSGLPPLPIGYQSRCVDVPGPWKIIRPKRPEIHDLIVTKLRRFHRGDREDIQILADTGTVDAATLLQRFNLAHAFSDRDDPSVVSTFGNLQVVVTYLEGGRRTI